MKSSNLKVGDKIRFWEGENKQTGYIYFIKEDEIYVSEWKNVGESRMWITQRGEVFALIKEVAAEEEIPVEHPPKFTFNFFPTSASRGLDNYAFLQSYMTGYGEWKHNGNNILNNDVRLPWPLNIDPHKTFRVTVEQVG